MVGLSDAPIPWPLGRPVAEQVVRDCPGLESVELVTGGTDLLQRTGVTALTLWLGEWHREVRLTAVGSSTIVYSVSLEG